MSYVDPTYLVTFAIAFAAILAIVARVSAHRVWRDAIAKLGTTWGQPLRHPRAHRPLAARTPDTAPPGATRLDDATWSDLDLPRVFERIDRTLTSVGAQTLHRFLRCPLVQPDALADRRALVESVSADPAVRVRMQAALARLGDTHGWEAWFAVGGDLPILPGPVWLLRLLPPLMLGSLAAAVLLDNGPLVVLGLALALALPGIHHLANRRIGPHLDALADLRRVLKVADGLRRVAPADVLALHGGALEDVPKLRRAFGEGTAPPSGTGLSAQLPELAAEYSKSFFLTEIVGYQRATRAMMRHRDAYDRMLDVVGTVDAAIAIACLRVEDRELCVAELDPRAPGLVAEGLRHPLVDDAVGNDVVLGPRGLVITGSNMAGKSTLLRAIGLNAVLAQSIGLAAADSYRARPLRVATSMRVADDLAAGVSLYRAEVDRIRELLERADGGHLFLLDEVFRGTNPAERVAASAAVLQRLGNTDLVVAATHDREICELLADAYAYGYFTEAVTDDDVMFDFRLRPGILHTTNAIALLERAGFPHDVVAEARRLAALPRP